MKITTLIENNASNENLISEHGLSLYIETKNHKILFDTGQSNAFILNAEKLNIDLKKVDIVVISHGHYDHLGGLIHFLKLNDTAKVFLKKDVFENHYVSIRGQTKKDIGYPTQLLNYKDRFVFINSSHTIIDNLHFISKIEKTHPLPKGNNMLYRQKESELIRDNFKHELILAIETTFGIHVFSGCAHNGILNMVSTVKQIFEKPIKTIIGGFHLIDSNEFVTTETSEEIKTIANQLNRLTNGANCFTGHCTSNNACNVLSEILGDKFHKLILGRDILISDSN